MRELWPWLLGVVIVAVGIGGWLVSGRAVDSGEAHALVASGAVLLDVRTAGEFAGGHLEGALNIPVDQIEARIDEIGDRARPVVVYCRSGSRSAAAAGVLRRFGFARVEDLGAMRNW